MNQNIFVHISMLRIKVNFAERWVNPLIVVNMGCEMMCILNQRLQAQAIAPEKSSKGKIRNM